METGELSVLLSSKTSSRESGQALSRLLGSLTVCVLRASLALCFLCEL